MDLANDSDSDSECYDLDLANDSDMDLENDSDMYLA